MAFMPKPINMVPNTLAAMRSERDWERREEVGGAMAEKFFVCFLVVFWLFLFRGS